MYNGIMIEGFLTTNQAAARVKLTNHHIRRLLERGTIEGVKGGRDWLVAIQSLDDYMVNRPKPGPKPGRENKHGK